MADCINCDNITYSGLDIYVDFTRLDGETQYSYIARRAIGKTGWTIDSDNPDLQIMKSTHATTTDNLDTIAVTDNGIAVGPDTYGHVIWYSEGATGSIRVIIPLGDKPAANALKYRSDPFAPGFYMVTPTNAYEPMVFQRTYRNVPTFNGNTMYYDYARKVWCYVGIGSEPALKFSDFGTTTISYTQGDPFFDFEKNHRLYYTMTSEKDVLGDVNGTGRVNIVDAQVAYDGACGKLAPTKLSAKRLLMCDVNRDEYVDAADAFAIQSAALTGAWG